MNVYDDPYETVGCNCVMILGTESVLISNDVRPTVRVGVRVPRR